MSCDIHQAHFGQPKNLDDEIVALTFQLEEIKRYSTLQKGKHRADEPPDGVLALSSFQTEVEASLAVFSDLKLAQSISQAIDSDGPALAEAAREECQNERDRRMALRLGGQNAPHLPCAEQDARHTQTRAAEQLLKDLECASRLNSRDRAIAGPSTLREDGSRIELRDSHSSRFQCTACDKICSRSDAVRAPCKDAYCLDCLKHLFMNSTKDQTLFPPRCCRQEIDLNLISRAMSPEELNTFREAQVEFTTTNRTYCSNAKCATFVPPTQIVEGHRATCTRCGTQTCAHCKNTFHAGECEEDHAVQATLRLAKELGWQRCRSCQTLVELERGCYHITCKCGGQFCYLCGVEWKHCTCESWDERNLMGRAEEIVDREAARPLQLPERQLRVGQMRQELLAHHECNHPGRFQMVSGASRQGFQCEFCGDRHWKYILRCRRCHIQACQDCRRHRI